MSALLQMDDGEVLHIPLLYEDEEGYFIPISLEIVGNKLFKLHCNNPNCRYEWEGRVFDYQCPRCKSTDIIALPNW